jgi:hypothetical protein
MIIYSFDNGDGCGFVLQKLFLDKRTNTNTHMNIIKENYTQIKIFYEFEDSCRNPLQSRVGMRMIVDLFSFHEAISYT